jgi:hypothetical protein
MNDNTQRNIRRIIGSVALLLPWACIITAWRVQSSISSYYYSFARDILTGALLGIGTFLVAYKGYDRQDTITSNIAGAAAFFTGLIPCSIIAVEGRKVGTLRLPADISGAVHGISAAILFFSIFYMVMFLFTKGSSDTRQKKLRNLLYRICGLGILAGFVLFLNTVFWSEVLMLTCFGIAWLVKGETILQDTKESLT